MFYEKKKDDCGMLRKLRTLYAKSYKIISIFSHCTIDVKLLLIKSYCTSFYCGYMWTDYTKTTYIKLRVAFNNVYRRILGLSNSASIAVLAQCIPRTILMTWKNFSRDCIVLLYCFMRPYTEGPIGPLSYRHFSGVVRNPHSALAE